MQTAMAEKPDVRVGNTWPTHHDAQPENGDGNTNKAPRFTRVTRDTGTVSVVVSETPIPQPQSVVSMSLFGDEWSPPEITHVEKRTRGNYAKKADEEEEQAAKFRYVAVQNRLRAWDSDEVMWLHDILLNETNREMRTAIKERDLPSILDKLAWYEDTTWRPFSFPVCCAICDADPAVVLQGIHQGLAESSSALGFSLLNESNRQYQPPEAPVTTKRKASVTAHKTGRQTDSPISHMPEDVPPLSSDELLSDDFHFQLVDMEDL